MLTDLIFRYYLKYSCNPGFCLKSKYLGIGGWLLRRELSDLSCLHLKTSQIEQTSLTRLETDPKSFTEFLSILFYDVYCFLITVQLTTKVFIWIIFLFTGVARKTSAKNVLKTSPGLCLFRSKLFLLNGMASVCYTVKRNSYGHLEDDDIEYMWSSLLIHVSFR